MFSRRRASCCTTGGRAGVQAGGRAAAICYAMPLATQKLNRKGSNQKVELCGKSCSQVIKCARPTDVAALAAVGARSSILSSSLSRRRSEHPSPPGPAAAAATPAASPLPAAQPTPPMPGLSRDFRIDPRGWTSKSLEPGASPEAFQIWRGRALCYLSQGRQDIRRMLQWAESQSADEVQHGTAAHARGLGMPDFERVDFILHGAVMHIIGDSLLGRARCCEDRGILLWRTLGAEWARSAPQYRHAKARRYQDPPRAKDVAALWAALPAWERLGEEVRTAGFDAPDWVRAAALEPLRAARAAGRASSSARARWRRTRRRRRPTRRPRGGSTPWRP